MSRGAPPEHGTLSRYRRGCRCAECRAFEAARRKKYRDRAAADPVKPASPVLQLLTGGKARSSEGDDDNPVTLEDATKRALETVPDEPLLQAQVVLAQKLARQIDHPSSSTSIGPVVREWRDLVAALTAHQGGPPRDPGLERLAGILGSR